MVLTESWDCTEMSAPLKAIDGNADLPVLMTGLNCLQGKTKQAGLEDRPGIV